MSKNTYVCKVCNKYFKNQSALSGHLRMHGPSNGKPTYPKVCCIVTHEVIEVRYFENHFRKLILCKYCQTLFKSKYNSKFCSRSCAGYFNNKPAPIEYMKNYQQYRDQSKFRFNIGEFPDHFDLKLLSAYRMYNSVSNPNGISRDHIFSAKDGFDQQIDPSIIAHPANCQLIRQNGKNGNSSKGSKSNITIKKLLEDIEIFNTKYDY